MHTRLLRPIFAATLLLCTRLEGEVIPVRFPQGSAHAFLAIKTLAGNRLAIGDLTQVVAGNRVTSRLIFHFRDGSIDDETAVFTQRGTFRLVSDHLIQRGPSFPEPVNFLIEALTGKVTWHTKEGEVKQDFIHLPADIANGLHPNLLMNILPSTAETKISFLVPQAKPRLIQVSIKPAGKASFTIGGKPRSAVDYVLHVELGGFAGVVAPLIGKQPPDFHIWVMTGVSPAFIREEGPLYEGGPIWRIEQISPAFPR